ncbi:Sensor histidine kinase [hydrothermal vent metagenome]|uniref:Sensor histidine kinase n=1 Tax=hydrothermal vent metagenome TaxID=652676 RepID=A0A3B1ANB4_9ZZZZ
MVTKSTILVVLIIGLVIGAYTLGKNHSSEIKLDIVVAPDNNKPINSSTLKTHSSATDKNIKFTHFRVGNRNVKSIYAEDDTIWVGTSGGVIRYKPKNDDYRLFDVRNGLLANGVFHVSRWKKNKILIGTYGGGLAIYDELKDKFKIYNVPDGLADAFVYDVLVMPNGDMWIATWSGANLVTAGNLDDPSAWKTFTVKNTNGGLPNDWVYGLALGKKGEVWFATEGGLSRYQNGHWKSWNHQDGQGAKYQFVKNDNQFGSDPAKVSSHHARQKVEMGLENITTAYNPNYIVALAVDKQGVVWIGTWGAGLSRFDGNTFKNYTVQDGLAANHVFMLHEDHNGVLWIGTSNGISRFKNQTFKNMTTKDGLFSNTIFSMDTQKDNTLWIGSFGGVARLIPETNNKKDTSQ